MIQKEGMDLIHNLLIQSLQVFEMSIDLGISYFEIKEKEGGCVDIAQ